MLLQKNDDKFIGDFVDDLDLINPTIQELAIYVVSWSVIYQLFPMRIFGILSKMT